MSIVSKIHKDCLDIIYEMSWKYYEAELSRGDKIISKAKTYCGAVGLTLSLFSFFSKDVILSDRGCGYYQVLLTVIFVITIAYLLLASISAMAAIKLTNVHKIGVDDIRKIAIQHSKVYERN